MFTGGQPIRILTHGFRQTVDSIRASSPKVNGAEFMDWILSSLQPPGAHNFHHAAFEAEPTIWTPLGKTMDGWVDGWLDGGWVEDVFYKTRKVLSDVQLCENPLTFAARTCLLARCA